MLRALALSIYANLGSGLAFGTVQTPNGTSPTATIGPDTLTFTSSDNSITITGTAVTKTVDFKVAGSSGATISMVVPPEFTVNSPVTTGGTFLISKLAQSANLFYAGPPTGSTFPIFRSIVQSDIPTAVNKSGDTMTGGFIESFVNVSGPTIAINASLGNIFGATLTANSNLAAPTNPTNGQKIVIKLRQDATGSRTLAFDPIWRFGNSLSSISLTTTAAKTDYIGAIYSSVDTKWDIVAYSDGY